MCVWDWSLNSGFYCLSHTSSPFCYGYFGDVGVLKAGLEL
jgi:hypothetical protein